MSADKHHNSKAFERYLKGQMSPEEAHTFEREVLDDPFAQEALEGLEAVSPNQVTGDIKLLTEKINSTKKKSIGWLRIAAMVAMLMVGSVAVFYIMSDLQTREVAMYEVPEESLLDSAQVRRLANEESPRPNMIEEQKPELKVELKKDGLKVDSPDKVIVEETPIEEEQVIEEIEPIPEEIKEELVLAELSMDEAEKGIPIANASPENFAVEKPIKRDEVENDKLANAGESMSQPIPENDRPSFDQARKKTSQSPIEIRGASTLAHRGSSSAPTVSGTVTDGAGEPLAGVTITIKNTDTEVVTDVKGTYMLPMQKDMVLVYSFTGYESQEVAVGSRTLVDITLSGNTALQEISSDRETQKSSNVSPAKPKVGDRAYRKYLRQKLQYPQEARRNNIEGIVTLIVTIDAEGDIADVKIQKSLGYGCDVEAIRLVKEGPEWEPARQAGINMEDEVHVNIPFHH